MAVQGTRLDLSVDVVDPFALADTFGQLGERFNRDMIAEMRALHERMMASDWEDSVRAPSSPQWHGTDPDAPPAASWQGPGTRGSAAHGRKGAAPGGPQSWPQAAEQLRQMGALVYLPEEEEGRLGWDDMAGYEEQKRALDNLVLLSVKHSEEFERVAKLTRKDGKRHRTKVRVSGSAGGRRRGVSLQREGREGVAVPGVAMCDRPLARLRSSRVAPHGVFSGVRLWCVCGALWGPHMEPGAAGGELSGCRGAMRQALGWGRGGCVAGWRCARCGRVEHGAKWAARVQAVLLEGPPGTGKTTAARVIASQADIPLVYIPLEAIASKWYGESEKQLGGMLNLAEQMGGCIIFLDEVSVPRLLCAWAAQGPACCVACLAVRRCLASRPCGMMVWVPCA